MIRFIPIPADAMIDFDDDGNPVPVFAFYDTVGDAFISFGGNQTWKTFNDFNSDYREEFGCGAEPNRYRALTPIEYGGDL